MPNVEMTKVVSLKEIKEAVYRSGYIMEQRIIPPIEKFDYYVTPNHNFKDQDTGQSREIDIHAISARKLPRGADEFIWPILLIKCKRSQSPFVFFTRDNVLSGIDSLGNIFISGLPVTIPDRYGGIDLPVYLKFEKFHHYSNAKIVSSQFCVIRGQRNRLIATHEHIYDDTILPLIKALKRETEEYENAYTPEEKYPTINLVLYYPIVMLNAEMYECYLKKSKAQYRKMKHINFIRHYASKSIEGNFHIDIVTEDHFKSFMKNLDDEIEMIVKKVKYKRKFLLSSIQTLARRRRKKKK